MGDYKCMNLVECGSTPQEGSVTNREFLSTFPSLVSSSNLYIFLKDLDIPVKEQKQQNASFHLALPDPL